MKKAIFLFQSFYFRKVMLTWWPTGGTQKVNWKGKTHKIGWLIQFDLMSMYSERVVFVFSSSFFGFFRMICCCLETGIIHYFKRNCPKTNKISWSVSRNKLIKMGHNECFETRNEQDGREREREAKNEILCNSLFIWHWDIHDSGWRVIACLYSHCWWSDGTFVVAQTKYVWSTDR